LTGGTFGTFSCSYAAAEAALSENISNPVGCGGFEAGFGATVVRFGSSLKIWKPAAGPAVVVAAAGCGWAIGVGLALETDEDVSASENIVKAGAVAFLESAGPPWLPRVAFSRPIESEWITKAGGCLYFGSSFDAEASGAFIAAEEGLVKSGVALAAELLLLLLALPILLVMVLVVPGATLASGAAAAGASGPGAVAAEALCRHRGSLINFSCSDTASFAEARRLRPGLL
jgi:hypothetical protein